MKLITGIVTAVALSAATAVGAAEVNVKKSTQQADPTSLQIGGLGTENSGALIAGGLLLAAILLNQGSSSTTTTTTN